MRIEVTTCSGVPVPWPGGPLALHEQIQWRDELWIVGQVRHDLTDGVCRVVVTPGNEAADKAARQPPPAMPEEREA